MAKTSKAAIVNEARELFRERGFAGASMKDLSERVGLLKGSLYSHFPSKESLIGEVLGLTFQETFLAEDLEAPGPQSFKAVIDRLVALLIEKRRCVGLHLAYGVDERSEGARPTTAFFESARAHLAAILAPVAEPALADALAADSLARIEGATLWLATRNDAGSMRRAQAEIHARVDALSLPADEGRIQERLIAVGVLPAAASDAEKALAAQLVALAGPTGG